MTALGKVVYKATRVSLLIDKGTENRLEALVPARQEHDIGYVDSRPASVPIPEKRLVAVCFLKAIKDLEEALTSQRILNPD